MASHSSVTSHCEAVQGRHYGLTDSIVITRSGNLILKNGQPSMYLFDGGYASFDTNGAVNGWHYYIQDYMGNNRMVVNKNGTVEQVTHYYPYGGVIGDISTNESVQAYKFEGKELDRTFGVDNYDIHARQYFAMMPSWNRIDPLAEDNPQFSPYSYCMGNPINFGDYNGMDWYGYNDSIEINGVMTEVYSIRYTEYTSQEELDKKNISGDYLGERVVSTKEEGKAGGLVSTGCILIDSRQWNNFEQQIGNNGFSLILRRR